MPKIILGQWSPKPLRKRGHGGRRHIFFEDNCYSDMWGIDERARDVNVIRAESLMFRVAKHP